MSHNIVGSIVPLFNRQNTGEGVVKLSSNVVKQQSNGRKDGGRIGEFARRTLAENSRPTAAGEFARFASR